MLAVALFAASVLLEGDVDCPSPAGVRRELEAMLRDVDGPHDVVRLYRRRGQLVVELVPERGEPVERTLDGVAPCADLARAVAVIVATWQLELHPELAPAEPTPEPTPAPVPALVPAPPPARAATAAPLPSPGLRVGVGAAFSPLLASGASRAGVSGHLRLGRFAGPGVVVWGTGAFAHRDELAGGSVSWTRHGFALGASLRHRLASSLMLEGVAGPGLAWLTARPRDLPNARDRQHTSLGALLGARLRWGDRVGAWFGMDLALWPQPVELLAAGQGEPLQIPSAELWTHLGGSVELGRHRARGRAR